VSWLYWRIGSIDRCQYEFTQHSRIGLRVGLTQKQIDEIGEWKKSKWFTDEERAVLAFTDEAEMKIQVTDETFNNVRKYLTEQQVVELIAGDRVLRHDLPDTGSSQDRYGG